MIVTAAFFKISCQLCCSIRHIECVACLGAYFVATGISPIYKTVTVCRCCNKRKLISKRSLFLCNILLAIDACCSTFFWVNIQLNSRPLPSFYQYGSVCIDSIICQATPFILITQVLNYWNQRVCNDTFAFSYTCIVIVHCICIIEHDFIVG